MCDFGISGYLVDSVAKTVDAGCKPYMAVSSMTKLNQNETIHQDWKIIGLALFIELINRYFQPERIDPQGNPANYDIRSDVWSFGISMIEISTGVFPYKTWTTPFEQLKQVVSEEAPRLPATPFSHTYQDFITRT